MNKVKADMTLSNPVERAFTLARSGECRDVRELEQRLKHEGFFNVQHHLTSPSLRRQLREMMAKALQTVGKG